MSGHKGDTANIKNCEEGCKFYNMNHGGDNCINWERMSDSAADKFLSYYANLSPSKPKMFNIKNYVKHKNFGSCVPHEPVPCSENNYDSKDQGF